MNLVKWIVAWWRARQARHERDARLLAVMVLLTASTPGNPEPSEEVKQFVNRTLKRRAF